MYESAAAISRPEISAFLEEASDDPGLVAAKLLPIYTSAARAGRYPKIQIGAGALLKNYSTKRGTTGTYNEVARAFVWDTFDCQDYGLIERVDDVVSREMSNFFDVEVYTAKFVREELELDYEIRVAGLIFNANTFTVQNSSAAYTIANLATFNFPTDLNGIMYTLKLRRYAPNTIWMNRAVWNRIRASTFLQNYLYGNIGAGTQFRSIAPSDIGAAFGIPNVLICDASVDPTPLNKANAGQNAQAISLAALAPVWSSAYIGVGKVAGGDFKSGGMGRTISWGADVQGGMFITETYRDENRRGNTIRVRMNTAEKAIDLNACVLLGTQYS
jgi:hypothetical protein